HGLESGGANRFSDVLAVGGDRDAADRGTYRPFGNVNDHRPAANVGQRLAWKAGGAHAGGNENQCVHGATASSALTQQLRPVWEGVKKSQACSPLYVLQQFCKRPSFRPILRSGWTCPARRAIVA